MGVVVLRPIQHSKGQLPKKREEMKNIVRELIEQLGMSPEAIWVGLIGAIIQIFYKVNGFGWRMSITIIISGSVLSGYVMPVLAENVSPSIAYLSTFLIGYLSPMIFGYLNQAAPKILVTLGEALQSRIKKKGNE